jgi:hypothetical protein
MRTTDRRGYRPASFVSGSVLGKPTASLQAMQTAVQRLKFCDIRAVGIRASGPHRPSIWVIGRKPAVLPSTVLGTGRTAVK